MWAVREMTFKELKEIKQLPRGKGRVLLAKIKSCRIENTEDLFLLEYEQTCFHQADDACVRTVIKVI